jgi:hypothetical protein
MLAELMSIVRRALTSLLNLQGITLFSKKLGRIGGVGGVPGVRKETATC